MKRKLDVVESVMHYKSIMLLILVIGVVFGVYSLVMMPKTSSRRTPSARASWWGLSGATSNEVEEQMTKPLEKFLWGFKEIKKAKTYSESKDGVCYIFVELNDDINDKDEFWSKFKIRLQQFKSSLPTGVLALIANDDFGDIRHARHAGEQNQDLSAVAQLYDRPAGPSAHHSRRRQHATLWRAAGADRHLYRPRPPVGLRSEHRHAAQRPCNRRG